MIERLAKSIKVESHRLSLGASIGLARNGSGQTITSSEMLRRADVAMYASKRGGKMRCTWFNEAFDRSREQIKQLDDELRQALTLGQFRLHYQPLVDSTSREIVAVESLLRWERPDGKAVGPNTFIPVAEESGFINAIGPAGGEDVNTGERYGGRLALTIDTGEGFSLTPRIVYQKITADGFNRQEIFNLYANPFRTNPTTFDEREQYLKLREAFEDETLIADLVAEAEDTVSDSSEESAELISMMREVFCSHD